MSRVDWNKPCSNNYATLYRETYDEAPIVFLNHLRAALGVSPLWEPGSHAGAPLAGELEGLRWLVEQPDPFAK